MMALGIEPAIYRLCSTLSQLLTGYVVDIIAYRHLMYMKRRGQGHCIDQTKESFVVVCMQ
jgi:hypothetical protein